MKFVAYRNSCINHANDIHVSALQYDKTEELQNELDSRVLALVADRTYRR